jgi:hypothetical protein
MREKADSCDFKCIQKWSRHPEKCCNSKHDECEGIACYLQVGLLSFRDALAPIRLNEVQVLQEGSQLGVDPAIVGIVL